MPLVLHQGPSPPGETPKALSGHRHKSCRRGDSLVCAVPVSAQPCCTGAEGSWDRHRCVAHKCNPSYSTEGFCPVFKVTVLISFFFFNSESAP